MLFDSSIRRELTRTFGATLFVLLIIVLTMMLIRTLNFANKGTVDPSEVSLVLGFTVLAYFPTILTLSLFIAIVYTLSRMYRDSEMDVWFSSGQGLFRFLRPVLQFSAPVIVVIALLSVFGWPWANAKSQELLNRYQSRGDLERIAPGQFQESRDGSRVFYIDNKDMKERGTPDKASKLFIFARQPKSEVVVSAKNGHIRVQDNDRFAILNDGQSTEIHDDQTLTISRFQEYGIRIGNKPVGVKDVNLNDPSTLTGISPRIIPTQDLFRIAEGRFQGELGWRLGMALAGINFMLLALASSRVNPRSGRSGGLIVALLFFVAYFNLLNFGKNWVATGKINMPMMLLVLHGGVFVASLLWLWKRHTQWSFGSMLHRRRARETEVPT